MPIYEFSCQNCGHKFEALRLSSAGFKDVTCPKCLGKKVAKQMSTFAPATGGSSAEGACESGECETPYPGCSSGMCGMN